MRNTLELDEPKSFWTFNGVTLHEWSVLSRTARTFRVQSNDPEFPWKRTVMASAIGKTFHLTPQDALAAKIRESEQDIEWLKQRLQVRRSALGVYCSLLKKHENR